MCKKWQLFESIFSVPFLLFQVHCFLSELIAETVVRTATYCKSLTDGPKSIEFSRINTIIFLDLNIGLVVFQYMKLYVCWSSKSSRFILDFFHFLYSLFFDNERQHITFLKNGAAISCRESQEKVAGSGRIRTPSVYVQRPRRSTNIHAFLYSQQTASIHPSTLCRISDSSKA